MISQAAPDTVILEHDATRSRECLITLVITKALRQESSVVKSSYMTLLGIGHVIEYLIDALESDTTLHPRW